MPKATTSRWLSLLAIVLVECVGCSREPNLPRFEDETYLSVSGAWGKEYCVDVELTTNLPKGTVVALWASLRPREEWGPVQQGLHRFAEEYLVVEQKKTQVRGVFCREEAMMRGMVIGATVAGSEQMGRAFKHVGSRESHRRQVGPLGEALKGPLSYKTSYGRHADAKMMEVFYGEPSRPWRPQIEEARTRRQ